MSSRIVVLPTDYPRLDQDGLVATYESVIKHHFNHELERLHFKEVVALALRAIDGDVDNVWIEVPTGLGKSSVVKTLGEALLAAKIIDNYYVLTPKIGLMKQYEQEKGVHLDTLKGRANFKCLGIMCPACKLALNERFCGPPDRPCTAEDAPCVTNTAFRCPYKTSAHKAYKFLIGDSDEEMTDDEVRIALNSRCEYVRQYYAAALSPRVLTNPAYLFRVQQGKDSLFGARSLAFFDEAHNLPDTIQDMASRTITTRDWDLVYGGRYDRPFPETAPATIPEQESFLKSINEDCNGQLAIATEAMAAVQSGRDQEVSDAFEGIVTTRKASEHDKLDIHNRHRRLNELADKLHFMIKALASVPMISDLEYTAKRKQPVIIFKPLVIAPIASYILKNTSKKRILLSASFRDNAYWTDILGQDDANNLFIFLEESQTPVKNRPIIVRPSGSMSYSNREKNLPTMLTMIDTIMDYHTDQHGLILPFSYSMAKSISQGIRNKLRLIDHGQDKESRDAAIDEFLDNSRPDSVILSPYLSEGFDGRDDRCRFLILPKMPYPSMDDKLIVEKIKLGQRAHMRKYSCEATLDPTTGKCKTWNCGQPCMRWYKLKTALSLIQMLGRMIRHEKDWGSAYILDESFLDFHKKYRFMLPKYVQEAIRIVPIKEEPKDVEEPRDN